MSKRRQEVVYVAINVTLASISSVHLRQRSTTVYKISTKASKRCQKDVKEMLYFVCITSKRCLNVFGLMIATIRNQKEGCNVSKKISKRHDMMST